MERKKILLVDDEIDACSVLGDFLRDGFDVEAACDGEEALSKLNLFSPDCILLDLVMPKMDGLQAIPLIKAKCPNVKIIMLTASGNNAVIDQCLAEGASGYLFKPVDLDALTNAIETALCEK